ncbi:signal peptidase I [Brevibacillus borstelensis]|uniref:signal peptidase I n=1 Tax=Brevibacillus borstelensis TaxID=45462 RepID=UPI0030C5BF3E
MAEKMRAVPKAVLQQRRKARMGLSLLRQKSFPHPRRSGQPSICSHPARAAVSPALAPEKSSGTVSLQNACRKVRPASFFVSLILQYEIASSPRIKIFLPMCMRSPSGGGRWTSDFCVQWKKEVIGVAVRWCKRSGILILVVFVMINLFLYATSRLNDDRMPGIGGWRVLSVLTGSMSPAINAGDMVIVRRYGDKEPRVGDIITYWQEQNGLSLTTHRIVHRLENGYLQTKGDANQGEDGGWTDPDRVVGKVVIAIPYAAAVQEGLQKPPVLLTLLAAFIAFLAYSHRRGRNQSKRLQSETVEGELS